MITLNEAQTEIKWQANFTAGNLTGAWESLNWFGLANTDAYVIRSYGVAIALWHKGIGEIVADAYDHSQTTSKHANIVKRAWGLN